MHIKIIYNWSTFSYLILTSIGHGGITTFTRHRHRPTGFVNMTFGYEDKILINNFHLWKYIVSRLFAEFPTGRNAASTGWLSPDSPKP